MVFTGVGTRAFCTGGNTAEYATYYAKRPLEYLQYMRLFNDMVTGILLCDKPVICRVNGMRIGGGQEIGMACDFSSPGTTLDSARPARPRLGAGWGATDFLHLYVGYAHAAESLSLCEPWSAHKACRLGLLNDIVPLDRQGDGKFVANPFAVTDRARSTSSDGPAWETGRPAPRATRRRRRRQRARFICRASTRRSTGWSPR